MSEEMLKTVKSLLQAGKGDSKRLREILETIKQGTPVVMSDYRYVQDLVSGYLDSSDENQNAIVKPPKRDKSLEALRIRLAEGQITIEEFIMLKKALTED